MFHVLCYKPVYSSRAHAIARPPCAAIDGFVALELGGGFLYYTTTIELGSWPAAGTWPNAGDCDETNLIKSFVWGWVASKMTHAWDHRGGARTFPLLIEPSTSYMHVCVHVHFSSILASHSYVDYFRVCGTCSYDGEGLFRIGDN